MSKGRRCVLAAVFLVDSLCLASPTAVFADLTPARMRKSAPDFALADSHGTTVSLAGYKGKVVLLNFWATWCHGCQEEIPWFVEFAKAYNATGLRVIGVSMDQDGWKSVSPYLRKKRLNYPVVIGSQSLAESFGLETMPWTVLIDREGRIATIYSGVVNRAACEKEIRALMEAPATR